MIPLSIIDIANQDAERINAWLKERGFDSMDEYLYHLNIMSWIDMIQTRTFQQHLGCTIR